MSRGLTTLLCAAALATGGCRHMTHTMITSEASNYSPAMRVFLTVAVRDSLRIHVDSGFLLAPVAAGSDFVGRAMAVRPVFTVHVATTPVRSTGTTLSTGTAPERPWRSLTASTPRVVGDTVRLGVPLALSPFTVAFPLPDAPARSWVVLALQSDLITWFRDPRDASMLKASVTRGGVRVFACGESNLSGARDRARADSLRTSYSTWC